MNTKLTKIISGLFVATAAFQTASAGNITDIKVSSLPNKQKIVKVSFDKEVVNPTGFITSSPARIALDFEQTGISMNQQVLEYADPLLSKISAAQNSSRARLVLNLNKPGQYNTEVRGNEVWILINESDDTVSAPARPAVKAAPAAQAAAPAKQQAAVPFTESVVSVSAPFSPATQQTAAVQAKQTNIDFRKDGKNAGIIELAALGFAGQPDISQQR
ncbi:putative type IV pilus biogenesis and competence protein PilQ, partial [Neisseria polysaccharea ATCC 43768]